MNMFLRWGSGLCVLVLFGMGSSGAALAAAAKAMPAFGKYGCTSSRYKAASGTYEYAPRGSFTLAADGAYGYLGFDKPSKGSYRFDGSTGKISFRGGYFDKGEATPIEGHANRFYLVFPGMPESRWTCGLK